MKRSRLTEQQIALVCSQPSMDPGAEVTRKMGVSEQTLTAGRRSLGD